MKTIFVSSTFSDMHFERDVLRDIVAPAINDIARSYNDFVEFCDLRWGINTENTESEIASRKVLDVCLDEIDRSSSPMIIIIGDRYGWIPDEKYISSIVERKHLKVENLKKSVTSLEAEYGSLYLGRKSLVYIRTIKCDDELSKDYCSECDEYSVLLRELKSQLEKCPNCLVKNYTVRFKNNHPQKEDLESFSRIVLEDLRNCFQPDWEKFSSLTPFQRELERRWTFIREKNSVFNARELDANRLIKEITNEEGLITICKGPSGSGKTTLFSHVCLRIQEMDWYVLPFIVGLTDESNDAMSILRNTVFFLEDKLGKEHFCNNLSTMDSVFHNENRGSLETWQERLRNLSFEMQDRGSKVLVAVDAADQLFPDEIRDSCGFIPDGISNSVHFFVTSLPHTEFPQKNFYGLHSLMTEDIKKVISAILNRKGKELSERVIDHILSMENSDNPYYISMVIQRLCMMGMSDFQEAKSSSHEPIIALGDKQIDIINECPDSIEEMCVKLFKDAINVFGSQFLNDSINLIAVSRYGLRRNDLATLAKNEWSELMFSRLINYLYEDFHLRLDGRIDFVHKTVREGLMNTMGSNLVYDYQKKLSRYLHELNYKDPIRMDEYPYHLVFASKLDEFSSYIKIYELGEQKDSTIIKHAAKTVHDVCIYFGYNWLISMIENCYEKSYRNELLWFVINELAEEFGGVYESGVYKERLTRMKLLKACYKCLEYLYNNEAERDDNYGVFYGRLSEQMVLDCELIEDDALCAKMGNIYLNHEKMKYVNKKDVSSLICLYYSYYKNLFCHKCAKDINVLREGISIAKEGEALISEIENIDTEEQYYCNFGWYYGCLGEIYLHIGDNDNCLRAYLKDLQYRKKDYDSLKTATSRMSLVGGYMNVAQAYELYEQKDKYRLAYENYKTAIEYFELSINDGAKIMMPTLPINVYHKASEAYINANLGDMVNTKDFSKVTIWALKACDYARYYVRELRDPQMMIMLYKVSNHLSCMTIVPDYMVEYVDILRRWIEEDENELTIHYKDDYCKYIHFWTCYVTANFIWNCKKPDYYDIAIKCCTEGIEFAEYFLENGISIDGINYKIESEGWYYLLDFLYEIEYQIVLINGDDIGKHLDKYIEYEEKKYASKGIPSSQLAFLCFVKAKFLIENKCSISIVLNSLIRSKTIYNELKSGVDSEQIDKRIALIDELINTIENVVNRNDRGSNYDRSEPYNGVSIGIDSPQVTIIRKTEALLDNRGDIKLIVAALDDLLREEYFPNLLTNNEIDILKKKLLTYKTEIFKQAVQFGDPNADSFIICQLIEDYIEKLVKWVGYNNQKKISSDNNARTDLEINYLFFRFIPIIKEYVKQITERTPVTETEIEEINDYVRLLELYVKKYGILIIESKNKVPEESADEIRDAFWKNACLLRDAIYSKISAKSIHIIKWKEFDETFDELRTTLNK